MAEVTTNDVQEVASTSKAGRHSRFTPLQDLVIAREVAAAKAHTPAYGETKKRFEVVAIKVNLNEAFKDDPVTWKAAQDRYKRLQEQYCEMDDNNQRLSGVGGGEMGELADLLMTLREARDDWMSQKNAVKTAEKKKGADKERMGQALVDAATKRKAGGSSSDADGDSDVAEGEDESPVDVEECIGSGRAKKKLKARTVRPEMGGGEMDRFGAHMKEADLARVNLERDKLAFEQERAAADRIERDKVREEQREERDQERHERREERVEQQKLELEKFKAMIELVGKRS